VVSGGRREAARRRRGTSQLGCLVWLLMLVFVTYFSVNVGKAYYAFREFQDRMESESRNAAKRSDAQIHGHLVALADSLGLPESAHHVYVRRVPKMIYIWAHYYQTIELPGFVYQWHFNPQAKSSL
jgi:hypothetical protein